MTNALYRRGHASLITGLMVLTLAVFTTSGATSLMTAPGHHAATGSRAVALQAFDGPAHPAGEKAASSTPAQAPNDVWSGAVVHKTSTSVHARWTEPPVKCGATTTYGAIWVGLDGDGSNTVEQTGVQESCNDGLLSADGWYEMYPKPAVALPAGHVVEPGDQMRATVTYQGSGVFLLQLRNVTLHWLATESLSAPGATRVSAEVVIETPESATPNLNDFKTVTFSDVTVNHHRLAHWDNSMVRYNLVAGNGTLEDTTSLPSAASFSVQRAS